MGVVTGFPVTTSIGILEEFMKVLTLGTYSDLSTVLKTFSGAEAGTPIVVAATVFKWGLIVLSIYAVVHFVASRLNFTRLFELAVTAAIVVAVILFIATPVETMEVVKNHVSPFVAALSSSKQVDYTPYLLNKTLYLGKILELTSNAFDSLNAFVPSSISVPTMQKGLQPQSVSIAWLPFLIDVVIVIAVVYVISKLNSMVAAVAGLILLLSVVKIDTTSASVLFALLLSAVAMYVLVRIGAYPFLAYPIALMAILVLYLVQPPVNVLSLCLVLITVMTLYPLFYVFAWLLYGTGELLEKREKLGMKKKPVRYVEERAGEWDISYTAFLMTALFSTIMAVYGLTFLGIGTFFAVFFSLVKG